MWNLERLKDPPALGWYDRIVAAKHLGTRALLKGLRPSISQRYAAYAQSVSQLGTLSSSPFAEPEREALDHCYVSDTRPLNELKAEIRKRQTANGRALCAYCGFGEPRTFEHYVPREDCPEYSVYPDNLLPACGACNTLKGTQWRDEATGERKVLHLYFDRIPHEDRWLYAEIDMREGEPQVVFHLVRPQGVDAAFFALVQQHYRTLRLLERYRERAGEVLSEALDNVPGYALEPSVLGAEYAQEAAQQARHKGANFWKVATYQAMASSREFHDLVCRRNAASLGPQAA